MPAINQVVASQLAEDREQSRLKSQQRHYQRQRYIMRLPEVMAATGYKRSSIYNFMREGDFPKARQLGARAVGWDSLEIQEWICSKLGGQN